jgi:hypothetical protein
MVLGQIGKVVGGAVEVLGKLAIPITVIYEGTLGAKATASDDSHAFPKQCDRKDDPCYAQYIEDTGWCGENITDDWDYDTCMGIAWENYERCKGGFAD